MGELIGPDFVGLQVPKPGVDLAAVGYRERFGWGVAPWMLCEDADVLCAGLEADGVEIAQRPFDGSFGMTFAFVDPDGCTITAHEKV